ncbi:MULTISPECIES: DJ-1/PfpI family protein [unclassified Variovorax]|uniref:DJ-1/PfpI family protein n=1 Tax=unclassified Variovorax TaxID=663243 RepID=UPI00076BD4FD|nr:MULTISPECIES: DJ-1/PfpI family protein [unclassified Variovorax]KWT97946.1 transcriptional regulator, AraC family [Variovorax sp. WDL1]PNG59215.1 Isonitrile hydratase [Variovorax sp. B4]PNG60994.1 Isonitrile hydratase [Variovorax sp. B2]VTV13069.1 Isonitrile hydratase [Variovorax sp. WDL1]
MKFAFLLYEGVEPIDLAAIGVISMAKRVIPELNYLTVATDAGLQRLSNGLRVAPDFTLDDCPGVDAIIVPGGPGWPAASNDEAIRSFLRRRSGSATLVSVCTGAMILATAGLLDGRSATTKCEVRAPELSPLGVLAREHPEVDARKALVVDSGTIITGGGVSLCIDAILHVLATRIGADEAAEVARIIEYAHAWQANKARLPTLA